jgi:hypothetical protein
MSDSMKPLLEGDADDFERMLLRAKPEEAPAGARERAIASLGLSAVSAPAQDGPQSTAAGAPSSGVFATKWVLPLCLIVAGGVASMVWSSSSSSPREAGAPASTPAVLPATGESVPSEPAVSAVAAPAITPNSLPDAPPAREATAAPPSARRVATAPANTPIDDALARETAAIDAARRALAAGEAARTLDLLAAHDREFPAGVFMLDAGVLRIEALERAGRTAEAKRLGDEFLASHPDGSYARRVRTALDRMSSASQ